MKIRCRTLFDCSRTGITGRFRVSELPFQDHSGTTIANQQDWTHGRNRQRNWETLVQILSLRTQPQELSAPVRHEDGWVFEFEIERDGVYGQSGSQDEFAELKKDAQNIPMLIGLGEIPGVAPRLETQGTDQNIWFETINN